MRRRISLKGDFGFDAISPDGRLMYLHVVAPRGRVLARIDTRTHRLVKPRPARSEDAGTSWLPLILPAAVLVVLAAVTRRRLGQSADELDLRAGAGRGR